LGQWRTLARHVGIRRKRTAQNRFAERRGSGADRHAARRGGVGPRVQRQRHVLLRWRKQRKSERRPSTGARLRSQAAELGTGALKARRLRMSASVKFEQDSSWSITDIEVS